VLSSAIIRGLGRRPQTGLMRLLLPFIALGLATLLSLFIYHLRQENLYPTIPAAFFVAIMISAWWGGFLPGVLGCLLGMFAAPYAFNPHIHLTISPVRLSLSVIVSILISLVAQRRNETEAMLRNLNESLDERVRQRTAELQRSNAELSRLNEDLNQFAYSASHDLQEPLRMIAIYSQLLERKYRGKLDSQADEYIGIVVQGAKRMEMLLRDLLSYSKTINIAPEPVTCTDGNDAAAKALSNLSAAIQESAAKVSVDRLPALNVREVHLVQLFQNLIGNAIKYRGDNPPVVDVTAQRQGDQWTFNVKDNGIGIPTQYREHVFRVFKRLHSLDKYEGTGMGLAICQRIVERYGGRIWVESEEGHGSTFHFTLPARIPVNCGREQTGDRAHMIV